ncbi:sulfite exporter TauE/SafE family protein [Pseudolabrys sp. FHR47]|uniref:sulfite exporter TauE/SafE family protein n=1 Tax=Pseudolabrys sp. FHR47 TaxID=2562284 RepID=UPI0010BEDBF4|nr:sulfite exporter TauE/SafE family protein [Pseudolabrys sp. FHR47]
MTVITDPLFYALAIPAVIALGLSKGGFAGMGQMATPMLAIIMPPLEAAAILLPIMLVQDANAVWVYRKDWSGRIVAIFVSGSLIGIGIAWWLASYISDAAVRLLIGGFTIAFVAYSLIGMLRVPREPGRPGIGAGVFWGALSGFTSTICQAGSPPYQMYALRMRLAKMTFVGTTAFTFALINAIKVVPYFALGNFSTKSLGTSLVLLPLAMAANWLGFWLVKVTPQERFYRIMLVVMLVLALELTREGVVELWLP